MRLIDAHLAQIIADHEIGGETASLIQYVLSHTPTIDAVPVRHGRWVNIQNGKGCCSECNRLDAIDPIATHCRYCGARMDGVTNG